MRDTLITPYGIATEGIKSPKYPNATYLYWRGAIWTPTMYMLIDGLDRCGEKALAKDLAKAFCDMCTTEGFAENSILLQAKDWLIQHTHGAQVYLFCWRMNI